MGKADDEFGNARRWRQEADALRAIVLQCGLTEELKWGKPCYTRAGRNICIIQRMKDFLALLFFKGALLKNRDGVLEVQGPNSRAGYRMRFTSVAEVTSLAETVKACIREAIDVERAGLKIAKASDPAYPDELTSRFREDPDFKAAFDRLTPGRRRGYVLHFAAAKRSATRLARIDRHRRSILDGKGLHDR